MPDKQPDLTWRDGQVPVSLRFDDPYYSVHDGLAETRHVFLAGNDLPDRFVDGFHIAELGFGTGLNMLVAEQAWHRSGVVGRLHFTSFEAFPMTAADMSRALDAFPELDASWLIEAWARGDRVIETDHLCLTVVVGDARETLSEWSGAADAWFLDGFAPARNPELWNAELLQHVAAKTTDSGTFATYTAAGAVRRALTDAGFTVARTPGYGRKRHMSRGRK